MEMLVGEMGANYFITISEHLAALRKKKKKEDIQIVMSIKPCLREDAGGTKSGGEQWAQ